MERDPCRPGGSQPELERKRHKHRIGAQRAQPVARYCGSSSVLSIPVNPVMASDVSTSPRIISSTDSI